MHEYSLAQSLVETAKSTAEEYRAKQVVSMNIRLGQMACVQEEALRFAFGVFAEGTVAENAQLFFVRVPAMMHCSTCHSEYAIGPHNCPECGGSLSLTRGTELEVVDLDIV